jgi:beta-N-acetylhexosaminidase
MSPSALRRRIGELLIAGFSGHQLPVELRSLAREFGLGGVILFARNIDQPEQVAELAAAGAALGGEVPAWVSVDQEGGRVARLRPPFTRWPPMATLGRSGDPKLAERFARALARELRAVGITLDYAPVLDVHTNPRNPIIGDRALGERADDAARLGAAIVRTLQAEGVAACGKHFPGHGDTNADSHLELPVVEHPPDRLRAVEFVPFRAAIEAGVATIMTAHLLVPALDEERPATLSKRVVTDVLRNELKFGGAILSDSLDEMKAITDRFPVPRAAVLAIAAGCDAVLMCKGDYDLQAAALEALVHGVEADELGLARVEDAIARQRRAKERFLGTPIGSRERRPAGQAALSELVGTAEHQAIADEMAQFV